MVQVDVVVQDKRGAPVGGLTKDDFTISDSNVFQTIALFSQEGGPRTRSGGRSLPPDTYTNRLGPDQVPGEVTVVLLDVLNTPIEDQPYARNQVVNLLGSLQPQDHVAIYALNSNLYVLHDFTQDMGELIAAVRTYKAQASARHGGHDEPPLLPASRAPAGWQGAADSGSRAAAQAQQAVQMLKDFIDTATQRQQNMAAVDRFEATRAAFAAIANHLAPVPGRKNLVWVSGSFPLAVGMEAPSQKYSTQDARDFERRLERTTRILNQANIAVYPVDARGPAASLNFDAAGRVQEDPGQDQGSRGEENARGLASMDLVAERTGGRSLHNSNDLTAAVRRALADGAISYNLAFYPSHGTWDGKYHTLKVRVNRPGAQLTYRRGYFAWAEPQETEAELKAEMAQAVDSPIDATNLSVTVRVSPPTTDRPKVAELSLTLDVHEITVDDTRDGKNCLLNFLFVQRNDSGKLLVGEEKRAEFDLPEQKYESFLKSGMVVTHRLVLTDGVTQVKIVVRDRHSGAIGSLTIPLRVK